jgi:hypothetical protein
MLSRPQNYFLFVFVFCYFWVMNDALRPLTLQLTAAAFLIYLIYRKWKPQTIQLTSTPELLVLSTILLVLIGYSGGAQSVLIPLLYFLLFLCVLAEHTSAIIVMSLMIPLYLWAIGDPTPSLHAIATILSFPVLLPLLIFARKQFVKAQQEEKELNVESAYRYTAAIFLSTFLKPKLRLLKQLAEYPNQNAESLRKQLALLLEEAEAVVEEQADDPFDAQKTATEK